MFIGRINFTDIKISKTKTRKLIEDGAYTGWDDIRLPFLVSLRRRGYQPDAFTKYSLDVGLSQTDKTLTSEDFFKIINSNNRDIIDPVSNRYFFVPNPKGIEIKNAPEKKVELDLHPDNPRKGKRKFMTKNQFYITEDDFKSLKAGKLYRLMDCINFVKKPKSLEFDSEEYEKYKDKGEKIMHWLPISDDLAEVELLMPDNTLLKGYAEPSVSHLKEGEIVQFERVGFCRLDKKDKGKLKFWFAHK
jgi:glutamyl-tRNA synthetase